MKKVAAVALLLVVGLVGSVWAQNEMPKNVSFVICSTFTKQDSTANTQGVPLGHRAWKVGKIAILDTNQSTLGGYNIGTGVKVVQQVGFPLTPNKYDSRSGWKGDTLWTTVGDTLLAPFVNAEGISSDSLICATIDTAQMARAIIGADSLWVSNGYFALLPDFSPLTRFKVIGNSDFGAAVRKVMAFIWAAEYVPARGSR